MSPSAAPYLGGPNNDWHWPTFNIADIAITLGAVLILAAPLPLRRRKEQVLDQS